MDIDLSKKNLVWSEHERTAYTCNHEGFVVGLGNHPALSNAGLWNMLWLLLPAKIFDDYLKNVKIADLVITTGIIPYLVGTGWQPYDEAGTLVLTAASKLSPLDFLDTVKEGELFNDLILTRIAPSWAEEAQEKATTYSTRHLANVIQGNFGGKR